MRRSEGYSGLTMVHVAGGDPEQPKRPSARNGSPSSVGLGDDADAPALGLSAAGRRWRRRSWDGRHRRRRETMTTSLVLNSRRPSRHATWQERRRRTAGGAMTGTAIMVPYIIAAGPDDEDRAKTCVGRRQDWIYGACFCTVDPEHGAYRRLAWPKTMEAIRKAGLKPFNPRTRLRGDDAWQLAAEVGAQVVRSTTISAPSRTCFTT